MAKQIAYLDIRRYRPKRNKAHQGFPVVETLNIHLRQRNGKSYTSLGKLPSIVRIRLLDENKPTILPADRAKAWQELARWIEHLLIFGDATVVDGQYENRLKWEGWERSLVDRPQPKNLYDWQKDESALQRLRPQYRTLRDKLAAAIEEPRAEDFDTLYPNEYDDVGYSDDARRAIKEMKAVFGSEFVKA